MTEANGTMMSIFSLLSLSLSLSLCLSLCLCLSFLFTVHANSMKEGKLKASFHKEKDVDKQFRFTKPES